MEARALHQCFRPTSIAVVGASANPERFSGKIIPTLLRQGYMGKIYPVNPTRDRIADLPCYPDLGSIPGAVDCVIYALSPAHLDVVLDHCQEKQVKLLVVSSAGFGETGEVAGQQLQEHLVARAHSMDMRVLGPNCIGFANFIDQTCVSSAAVLDWPDIQSGSIGLVSQSGGLGLTSILFSALADGIGFSHVITTGNEADITTIDVANFFVTDDDTDVIAMTMEAVGDEAAFRELLRRAHRAQKPVVILKSGRTDLGKTMAASHTGALAGSLAVFESVCLQYGAICAEDYDDFYEISAMFAKLRRAGKLANIKQPASGCAALSLSGGHIGLFADHASLCGIQFPSFTADMQRDIAAELGFSGNFQNPLDTTAQVIGDDGFWGRCTKLMLSYDPISLVVPIITVSRNYERAIKDLISIAQESPKPIVMVWAGGDFKGNGRQILSKSNIPVFKTPSRAAKAIQQLQTYCIQRDAFINSIPRTNSLQLSDHIAQQFKHSKHQALTERQSKEILAQFEIPVTSEYTVESTEGAIVAAEQLGFPVVLKGEHPALMHKSDLGLVKLNLHTVQQVEKAYFELEKTMTEAGYQDAKVAVQPMIDAGVELILGVNHDPEFGPVVVLGLGGVFVEVLQDVVMRVAPFDRQIALEMINSLRGVRLLEGYRGAPRVDKEELATILVKLSKFADASKYWVSEVDINPMVLDRATGGLCALDALIVLQKDAN